MLNGELAMGMETFVVGYIDEAWVGNHIVDSDFRNRLFRKWNRRILNQLPEYDEWPPLVRGLFAWTEVDHHQHQGKFRGGVGGFRGSIIHFGGRFRQIEERWEEWLAKFESLLGRLYCLGAVIYLDTEIGGSYRFEWRSEKYEGIMATPPDLPTAWQFRGPFRNWAEVLKGGPKPEVKG